MYNFRHPYINTIHNISDRIKDLAESVKSSMSLLEAAVAGNVEALAPHFTTLVPLTTWALRSRLVSSRMCSIFVSLRSAVFDAEDNVYGRGKEQQVLYNIRTYMCTLTLY